MNSFKAMEKFLETYLKPADAVAAETVVAVAPETCAECNTEENVVTSCATAGCKRKRTKECASE